ncbi:MAG TPA: ferritin-like domain-containing protein [Chloroflexota bacterium]|nr:ferritin-like domain-containing protein [Chloroflexota bacterium]
MDSAFRDRASRASFIRKVAAAGAGLGVGGFAVSSARAAGPRAAATPDTVQSIINTALVAEQLATTFYYTALTTPAIMSYSALGGSSTDPNNPGMPPNGNPGNVRYFQAALDSEIKHAATLSKAGAVSPATQFFFPQTTFTTLTGTGGVLAILDTLETAFIAAYLVGISSFVTLGHSDLAELAAEIMGVESEHRAMGRVIGNSNPANNLTLEKALFTAVSQAGTALAPFLSGQGFSGEATAAIPLPTSDKTTPVIGTFSTRLVTMFL